MEPGVVANGKACGCFCPGCARPLIAYNQGKLRMTRRHLSLATEASCRATLASRPA